ncbi:Substrate-specific component BioY of biotin ECF transporter [Salisediminibacterium beveridgei]|uniref:Biotin transporter n=1 Tax=Salisediminibacterium beveridgei TaxID=632773 RepID=A0A1D7QSR2_9BACI|nr:Substrate-specific component BioY of biotin ECF transporter [Salisediminibacterium beveridgei]
MKKNVMIVYSGVMIALMAITANIGAFIMIGPIPLTLQSGMAVLSGILLGPLYGTLAIIGYLLLGLFGIPVFAGFMSAQAFFLPTAGFLLSFPIAALISGTLTAKSIDSPRIAIAAMSAMLIHYIVGTFYLFGYLNLIAEDTVSLTGASIMMTPFFVKDIIVTVVMTMLSVRLLRTPAFSFRKKEAFNYASNEREVKHQSS